MPIQNGDILITQMKWLQLKHLAWQFLRSFCFCFLTDSFTVFFQLFVYLYVWAVTFIILQRNLVKDRGLSVPLHNLHD